MARAAALLLGLLLLGAGAGKLASPTWPRQAAELGAPRRAVPIVPGVELALGALLLVGLARTAVALAAGALLAVFTGLIVLRLAQGRRPPCACFGGRSTRPIGAWTIARNAAMLILALLAALT